LPSDDAKASMSDSEADSVGASSPEVGGPTAVATPPPSRRLPSVYFNKMNQIGLDVYAVARQRGCEMKPSEERGEHAVAATESVASRSQPAPAPVLVSTFEEQLRDARSQGFFFFAQPPPPRFANGQARTKRDLLCIEHLHALNDALCHFYATRCGEPSRWQCPDNARSPELQHALLECHDTHSKCVEFAGAGECEHNPVWMLAECAASCGVCDANNQMQPPTRELLVHLLQLYNLTGPLARDPMLRQLLTVAAEGPPSRDQPEQCQAEGAAPAEGDGEIQHARSITEGHAVDAIIDARNEG